MYVYVGLTYKVSLRANHDASLFRLTDFEIRLALSVLRIDSPYRPYYRGTLDDA